MSQYSETTKRALLSVPIVSVLAALGKRTDRPAGNGPFYSPLREEKHPSFQINMRDNVWTDWGTGEKGGVVDLVCRLRGCSRYEAMDFLASLLPYVTEEKASAHLPGPGRSSSITVESSGPICSTALLTYSRTRGIDDSLTKRFCEEVRFHFNATGHRFFSLGFRNNMGGYALRNGLSGVVSKISSMPNGVTTFKAGLVRSENPSSSKVMVLEGFMDFLSLLQMHGDPQCDVCVLNSGANIRNAIGYISSHEDVSLLLDNDVAGDAYTDKVIASCPGSRCMDCRPSYSDYNDLNDLLLGHPGVRKPSCHQKAQDMNV